jgi:hypothetical protein
MTGWTGTIKRAVRLRRVTPIALAGSLVGAGLVFVTAQAAGASWLMLDTPTVPGASVWEFNAVGCTGPHTCMAVGDSSGSTSQLLSEIRTQAGWTIKHVPQPAPGSGLFGVRCTFIYSCVAVGDAPNGSGGTAPLAERWNGSSWRIQTTPKPKGSASSQFSRVTCTTALDCVAVGFASTSLNNEVPLVEHWDGKTWKIEKAPTRSGFTESVLNGVACPSSNRCIAVGDSFKPSPFKIVSLVELWNGSTWTIQKSPSPASGGQLSAVGCPSRTRCLAVGDGFGANWNGKKWSLVKLASPGGPADLTSISCRPRVCYADGGFFQDAVLQGVIEFWNGSRWQVQNANINTSFDSSVYAGISCTTDVNCTAVGSYHDPITGNRTLAQDFSLRWQNISPAPFFGVTGTFLNGVSCASPNACVAVGSFSTTTGNDSFSDTWDGSTWTSQSTPKQASTGLNAVSCKTSTFCIAAGTRVTGGHDVTLAERWNGITWVIQKTPNPTGAVNSFFFAISCPATNACTAVGSYQTHGGSALLTEQWNGKSWRQTHTPRLRNRSGLEFLAVSCGSAKACEAIAASSQGYFAERWNGTSWTEQTMPPQKGGTDASFSGVSCVAANTCIAVGDDLHGGKLVPIGERWNGRTWTAQQAAIPAHATSSGLTRVSCVSASLCEAGGFVTTEAIAELWNGRSWSLQSIDQPIGSIVTGLQGLSCKSSSACIAVGFYEDSGGMDQILAEQFS